MELRITFIYHQNHECNMISKIQKNPFFIQHFAFFLLQQQVKNSYILRLLQTFISVFPESWVPGLRVLVNNTEIYSSLSQRCACSGHCGHALSLYLGTQGSFCHYPGHPSETSCTVPKLCVLNGSAARTSTEYLSF